MSMWNNKGFTENELSPFAKVGVIGLFVIPVIFVTGRNIFIGEVNNPYGFALCIFGLTLFIISKLSLFLKGSWINFGTKNLTENMANFYRIGYWFMGLGLIFTFCN